MFATHVLSAGQTDTGHYIDSHFSCESKSLFNFDGVAVGVTGGGGPQKYRWRSLLLRTCSYKGFQLWRLKLVSLRIKCACEAHCKQFCGSFIYFVFLLLVVFKQEATCRVKSNLVTCDSPWYDLHGGLSIIYQESIDVGSPLILNIMIPPPHTHTHTHVLRTSFFVNLRHNKWSHSHMRASY